MKELLKKAFEAGADLQYETDPINGDRWSTKAPTFEEWYKEHESEILALHNVVKPKGTFCQNPDKCQMSYYHQIGDYYCSKCEKTGLV